MDTRHVSILVLVDVALQRLSGDEDARYEKGFNPCFSGCCSATKILFSKKS